MVCAHITVTETFIYFKTKELRSLVLILPNVCFFHPFTFLCTPGRIRINLSSEVNTMSTALSRAMSQSLTT